MAPSRYRVQAATATGQPVRHLGSTKVTYLFENGQTGSVGYEVLEGLTRPVLVAQLPKEWATRPRKGGARDARCWAFQWAPLGVSVKRSAKLTVAEALAHVYCTIKC